MKISRTKNENYISYLVLELLLSFLITFLGVAIIVFYIVGRMDSRRDTQQLETLFDTPFLYVSVCTIPALIAVAFLLYFRNRNFIVGYHFDEENKVLNLLVRGLRKSSVRPVSVPFRDISVHNLRERKFLFNARYEGLTLTVVDTIVTKYDFVSNNFIWENQIRERVHFINEARKRLSLN